MSRLKVPVGVVALATAIGVLIFGSPDRGQAQVGSTPVRVVNTPLPVTGDVTAAVTGQVSLVAGTVVNIGNGDATPIPVREVGSGKVPVKGFEGCFYLANGTCVVDLYTVPAGYSLVVENVSGQTYMFGTDRLGSIVVGRAFSTCCLLSNEGYLVPHQLAVEGASNYNVSNQTLMFFDEGDTVRVLLSKFVNSGSASGVANMAFAGYLTAK